MPEDIIKAYNKTKINGIYLYNCYLEPSIKSDLALSDYFSRLEVNKPIKDNDSIFFSLLKFTGNAFYKKASPYYEKYSQVKRIRNQNLPIICYNEENQNLIQRSVFEAKNPLSSNFDKIIVNKISLGDFACMEFVFTNSFQNSSEALKKYYSKENGKPISIIVATSSFINLINKEYRFHIERIPHLMKMFKNHQAQRSVNNEDLIKAFLQNAKEKESCLVYGNILSSIRDLKGSGNNEDKKILNYLKKDIDISSNKTGQVIQKLAQHKEFYDLVLVIYHTTKTTSPVEVARAISEHYAVCDDKDLKISLEGYLKKLGFSLEEFPDLSSILLKIKGIILNCLNENEPEGKIHILANSILTSLIHQVDCLYSLHMHFQGNNKKNYKELVDNSRLSIENIKQMIKDMGDNDNDPTLLNEYDIKLEPFPIKLEHIEQFRNNESQNLDIPKEIKDTAISCLHDQYENICKIVNGTDGGSVKVILEKYKTCIENCLSIFGVNNPKHFESLYQNKNPLSDITTRNKIEDLLSQIKDKNMKQYIQNLYPKNKEEALNQIYCNLDEQKQDEKDIKHKLAKIIPSLKKVSKFSYFKCTRCGDVFIEKLPIENRQCKKCKKGVVSSTLLYQEMQKIRINQDTVTDCVKFYFTQRAKCTTRREALNFSLLYSQTKVKSTNIIKVLESLMYFIYLAKSSKDIQDILFSTFLLFKGTSLNTMFMNFLNDYRNPKFFEINKTDPKNPILKFNAQDYSLEEMSLKKQYVPLNRNYPVTVGLFGKDEMQAIGKFESSDYERITLNKALKIQGVYGLKAVKTNDPTSLVVPVLPGTTLDSVNEDLLSDEDILKILYFMIVNLFALHDKNILHNGITIECIKVIFNKNQNVSNAYYSDFENTPVDFQRTREELLFRDYVNMLLAFQRSTLHEAIQEKSLLSFFDFIKESWWRLKEGFKFNNNLLSRMENELLSLKKALEKYLNISSDTV